MKKTRIFLGLLCLFAAVAHFGHANPTGGTVAAGKAVISSSGNTLTLREITNSAIVNWQGFSINANELTNIVQPSATSALLNRVVSANPSSILGKLQSNGEIFLINPNGIVFGPAAQVNVSGLVASTLKISDSDFLNSAYNFNQDSTKHYSYVVNQGNINANNTRVVFMAPLVYNEGAINATQDINLSGTTQATLTPRDPYNPLMVSINPTTPITTMVIDVNAMTPTLNNILNDRNNGLKALVSLQQGKTVVQGVSGFAANSGTLAVGPQMMTGPSVQSPSIGVQSDDGVYFNSFNNGLMDLGVASFSANSGGNIYFKNASDQLVFHQLGSVNLKGRNVSLPNVQFVDGDVNAIANDILVGNLTATGGGFINLYTTDSIHARHVNTTLQSNNIQITAANSIGATNNPLLFNGNEISINQVGGTSGTISVTNVGNGDLFDIENQGTANSGVNMTNLGSLNHLDIEDFGTVTNFPVHVTNLGHLGSLGITSIATNDSSIIASSNSLISDLNFSTYQSNVNYAGPNGDLVSYDAPSGKLQINTPNSQTTFLTSGSITDGGTTLSALSLSLNGSSIGSSASPMHTSTSNLDLEIGAPSNGDIYAINNIYLDNLSLVGFGNIGINSYGGYLHKVGTQGYLEFRLPNTNLTLQTDQVSEYRGITSSAKSVNIETVGQIGTQASPFRVSALTISAATSGYNAPVYLYIPTLVDSLSVGIQLPNSPIGVQVEGIQSNLAVSTDQSDVHIASLTGTHLLDFVNRNTLSATVPTLNLSFTNNGGNAFQGDSGVGDIYGNGTPIVAKSLTLLAVGSDSEQIGSASAPLLTQTTALNVAADIHQVASNGAIYVLNQGPLASLSVVTNGSEASIKTTVGDDLHYSPYAYQGMFGTLMVNFKNTDVSFDDNFGEFGSPGIMNDPSHTIIAKSLKLSEEGVWNGGYLIGLPSDPLVVNTSNLSIDLGQTQVGAFAIQDLASLNHFSGTVYGSFYQDTLQAPNGSLQYQLNQLTNTFPNGVVTFQDTSLINH